MTDQLDLFHQAVEPAPIVDDDPEPQPAADQRCRECGHIGVDVMYGNCRGCFDEWAAA